MGTTRNATPQEDVQAEIARRTAELSENVRRAKAAACSIPSPTPIELELIELLKKTTDPKVLRQLHVALESMKSVWEIARRVEARGVPRIVVARSALLEMANGYLAAQERGEILSPEEAQTYCLVAQVLHDTEPEWEAFCRFERLKQRRAEPRKTARGRQVRGLWEDRIEKLMAVWPKIAPIHGKPGSHWEQSAVELYREKHGEKLSARIMERVVQRAQDAGLIRRVRRRTA